MQKTVLLLALMFLLVGCSSNKRDRYVSPECVVIRDASEIIPIKLPNWFLTVPRGRDIAIGITADQGMGIEDTKYKARENATVSISRNRSCIVITKLKARDNGRAGTATLSAFKLQLAKESLSLESLFDKCFVKEDYVLNGTYIGLVSLNSTSLKGNNTFSSVDSAPKWYNDLVKEDKEYISCGKGSSLSIEYAYENAYKNAVEQLVKGLRSRVKAELISSYSDFEKFVEIETAMIIEDLRNSRNSLVLRKSGNTYLYDAYVEIRWEPKYRYSTPKVRY
ncbi:MAG: hypothetical protein B6226_01110 [Candidatus Cloacimonetes bacterium 4572_65]|nr:MAG: hypothetical protein B6226_01110 [Candidatus Cloacimonetes bacterium 4572_65]